MEPRGRHLALALLLGSVSVAADAAERAPPSGRTPGIGILRMTLPQGALVDAELEPRRPTWVTPLASVAERLAGGSGLVVARGTRLRLERLAPETDERARIGGPDLRVGLTIEWRPRR